MHKKPVFGVYLPLIVVFLISFCQQSYAQADWVKESNQHSKVLLDVIAKHYPESGGQLGIEAYDSEIRDLTPGYTERILNDLNKCKTYYENTLSDIKDGPIKQDLQILLKSTNEQIEEIELERKYLLPYFDLGSFVYEGIRSLLEDRIPQERRIKALIRLKKYVGSETGFLPMTELAMNEMKKGWNSSNRLAPFKEEVERNLSNTSQYIEEVASLFEKYEIEGYEEDYLQLKHQIEAFDTYILEEILPKAREDFKLPKEVYAFKLKSYGVDMPVDELRNRAMVTFKELQTQMQVLANDIALKHDFPSKNYRDVLRSLKQQQLDSAEILPFYRDQIKEIENIIRDEKLLTLPDRNMAIRLATKAESAAAPAPFMSPPRLIGNTGEYGEFVLPLNATGGKDGTSLPIDDFTHEAASWPLTAHEGRPGHELQYTSIVERGVSQARIIFAMNSVNVEGWALYAEEIILPFIPIEGQFMTLWSRTIRAARAFLDPGLNLGDITTEEAEYILRDEVVLSEALVRSELERYRFRAPGQATSYFNGYLRLMECRAKTELLLGDKFNMLKFHDFILSQGLLPPVLIQDAITKDFVPRYVN